MLCTLQMDEMNALVGFFVASEDFCDDDIIRYLLNKMKRVKMEIVVYTYVSPLTGFSSMTCPANKDTEFWFSFD